MDDPHQWFTVLVDRLYDGSLCTCGECIKALDEFHPLRLARDNPASPYRALDALLFGIIEVRKYPCIGKYLVKATVHKLEQNEFEENSAIHPADLVLTYCTIEFQTFGIELMVELLGSKSQQLTALAVDNLWYLLLQTKEPLPICTRLIDAGIVAVVGKLLEIKNYELIGHTFGLFITILYGLEEETKLEIIESGVVQQILALVRATPATTETRVMLCKAVDVIGWLACGGTACQERLVDLGAVECFLALLACTEKSVVKSTWMALNWVIYCHSGKKTFLEGNGLEMVIREFKQSGGLTSSGVVFATRKLAQIPDIRSKLLQMGVLDCLIHINRGSNDRMKYVTALAMSFVCLDSSIEGKAIIDQCKGLDYIIESIKFVDPRRDLNILYNDLNDTRTLLSTNVIEIQCFGLWWMHHLLICEDMQIYKRKVYKEMAVRDEIIGPLCQLLKIDANRSPYDLTATELLRLELAVSTIYFLSKSSYSKNALINAGAFSRLFSILTRFMSLNASEASPSNSPKLKKSQLNISWDNAVEKLNHSKNQQMQQFIVDYYAPTAIRSRIKIKISDCLHQLTAEYLENFMDQKPISRDGVNKQDHSVNSIRSLFMLCENFIFSNLDDQNALQALEFATFHNFDRLKVATTTFIVKTAPAQAELSRDEYKPLKEYIDVINLAYVRELGAYETEFCQPLEVVDEEAAEDEQDEHEDMVQQGEDEM